MPGVRGGLRQRLLQAALEVLRQEGLLALTLERVAERAGVSKGGLLHHFPTKEDLLTGLLERELDRFEEAVRASGRPFLEGYVRLGHRDETGVFLVLLAASALYPGLLERARARFRAWLGRLPPGPEALLVLLATDGLRLADLLGTLSPPERERALEALLARAQEVAG